MKKYYLIHHYLTKRSKFYQKWHGRPYYEHHHWLVAVAGFLVAASALAGAWQASINQEEGFIRPVQARQNNYYVRDFGAEGDGVTKDTLAIQDAINTAAAAGGGRVILDQARTYLSGHLNLKSGTTLVIETGSRLKASNNVWDFQPNQCTEDASGNCQCGDLLAPLIFADNENNVGVNGGGVIEGVDGNFRGNAGKLCTWQGTCSGNPPTGPTNIFFGDVSAGTIKDITAEKTAGPGIVIAESDNITIDNVKVYNRSDGPQCNDALDIFGSQNITVRNSDFTSADDAIALKVDWGIYAARHMMKSLNLEPVDGITIENNRVYAPNGGHGLQIGSEVVGSVSNVVWRNNTIRDDTRLPVRIEINEGDSNTYAHHIYYDNNKMERGGLIVGSDVKIRTPIHECQYYDIFVNKDVGGNWLRHPSADVKTAAECEGAGPPQPIFTFSASPFSRTVIPGDNTSYTLTLTSQGGFTGNVNLDHNLPINGTTASFSSASVSLPPDGTVQATFNVTNAQNSATITLTATSGSLIKTTDVVLTANTTPPPTGNWVFCADENQFCSFTGTKEVRYGANGLYNYLTLTGGTLCANSVFGDPNPGVVKQCYYLETAPPPDFTLSASPSAQTVNAGSNTSYALTLTSQGGFTGNVNLSHNLPVDGTTASFSSASVSLPPDGTAQTTFDVTNAQSSATITLTATSGSLIKTTDVFLTVNTPPPPSLTADFNCDCIVNVSDFGILLSYWEQNVSAFRLIGSCTNKPDLNNDNLINAADMAMLLGQWGKTCTGGGGGAAFCGNNICEPGETATSCAVDCGGGVDPNSSYPRTAIFHFGGAPIDWYAKFDLVMTRATNASFVQDVKSVSPNVQVLSMKADMNVGAGIEPFPNEWCIYTSTGHIPTPTEVGYGNGPCFANFSNFAGSSSRYGGTKYNEYIGKHFSEGIDLNTYDGLATDGFWEMPYRGDLPDVDLDKNSQNDWDEHGRQWLIDRWAEGRKKILDDIRLKIGPNKIMLVNSGRFHNYNWAEANGLYDEHKACEYGYQGTKSNYENWMSTAPLPHSFLMGANRLSAKNDFSAARFFVASALTGDGYVELADNRSKEHDFINYYDEFDVNLGNPTSVMQLIRSTGSNGQGVYARFFANGAVIMNQDDVSNTVTDNDLSILNGYSGPYYRFKGGQDTSVNNGSLFTQAQLQGKVGWQSSCWVGDALILIKDAPPTVVSDIYIDNTDQQTSPSSNPAELVGAWTSTCNNISQAWTQSCKDWGGRTLFGLAYTTNNSSYAVFTPTIGAAGNYEVFEWHGNLTGGGAATNVNHIITQANGTISKIVNQQTSTGRWNSLGTYYFNTGTEGNLVISAQGANGTVIADGVKFVWQGP